MFIKILATVPKQGVDNSENKLRTSVLDVSTNLVRFLAPDQVFPHLKVSVPPAHSLPLLYSLNSLARSLTHSLARSRTCRTS